MIYSASEKDIEDIKDELELELFCARAEEIFQLYKFKWLDEIPTREQIKESLVYMIDILINDEEVDEMGRGRIILTKEKMLTDSGYIFDIRMTLDIT